MEGPLSKLLVEGWVITPHASGSSEEGYVSCKGVGWCRVYIVIVNTCRPQ